jgi:hypothetical protein
MCIFLLRGEISCTHMLFTFYLRCHLVLGFFIDFFLSGWSVYW